MSNKIVIIGFMGSGKTTVARALALRLGRSLVDLDELILQNEGRSPAEIIKQDGENEFRTIETRTLREVLTRGAALVVAVGGGAWTIGENRRLIAAHGASSVWLDAPFELCWGRIETESESRPLAPSRESARRLYDRRLSVYELADVQLRITEAEAPDEIALKMINEAKLS